MTEDTGKPDTAASEEGELATSDGARRVAEFAADLRRMWEEAGKPSSRKMAMKAGYSHTALLTALRGAGGRLPSLDLTLALVRACRGDEQTWRARWQSEHARLTARTKSRERDGSAQAVSAHSTLSPPPPLPSSPRHNRRLILLCALGVTVTLVIGGAVFVLAAHSGGSRTSHMDCVQTGRYDSCGIQQLADQIPKDEAPRQMKERIERFSRASPRPPGPWPFFVYDTIINAQDIGVYKWATSADIGKDDGVKVKLMPTGAGRQLGTVYTGSVIWADCYVLNSFHPNVPTDDDVGARWLRIHWPANTPTVTRSLPTDPVSAYVYAGYTLPFTHDGTIPVCP